MPTLRIGAIDDHPALLRGVGAALDAALGRPFALVTADTVARFLARRQRCDVVLLDLSLSDGSSATRNIDALIDANLPVLLYTHEHRTRTVARALLAGASGVVLKDQPIEDLADAVRQVAGGEPYLSAEWATAVESELGFGTPKLSGREREALQLYASGLPLKSVARTMGVAAETARMYLLRVRAKYGDLGRSVVFRTDYYIRAVEDGYLPAPELS